MTEGQLKLVQIFDAATDSALFDQITIAAVRGCSTDTMERDRWAGHGIPYRKLGRAVRYMKRDVMALLDQCQPMASTSAHMVATHLGC